MTAYVGTGVDSPAGTGAGDGSRDVGVTVGSEGTFVGWSVGENDGARDVGVIVG